MPGVLAKPDDLSSFQIVLGFVLADLGKHFSHVARLDDAKRRAAKKRTGDGRGSSNRF